MKRVLLALVLGLLTTGLAADDWVADSDAHARVLLEVMAEFNPELATRRGVDGVEDRIMDLEDARFEREQSALIGAIAELRKRQDDEQDPRVAEDIQIMLDWAENQVTGNRLQQEMLIPWFNLPEVIFGSVQAMLDPRFPEERRHLLVRRLERYAGLTEENEPIATLARERIAERMDVEDLLGPYRPELQRHIGSTEQMLAGTRKLLEQSDLEDWEGPWETLETQISEYMDWAEAELLPEAREESRLPSQLYAHNLRQVGVDISTDSLTRQAVTAFAELQAQMRSLAVQIADKRGWEITDYREILARLKEEQIDPDEVLDLYKQRLQDIEEIIAEHNLVTLPDRDASIRLADEAESIARPAPHMSPPRLIGNTGEYGEFVLPMIVLDEDGQPLAYDDFTHEAATWPLTAHEARPGHELQYSALVEEGVSIARIVFAMNSTNVEGWALYSEAIIAPYLSLEAQLATLQFRLLRAARAFLDPMINQGELSIDQARQLLIDDVVLSQAMARQEVDRYAWRAPGQATSYFYGYMRLMELRGRVELAMRDDFDASEFHDFILAQGILPPDMLAEAVMRDFVGAEADEEEDQTE